MNNDTTRRFPRTLDEAFPGSSQYATPIHGPARGERLVRGRWGIAGTAALALYVVAVLTRWLFS